MNIPERQMHEGLVEYAERLPPSDGDPESKPVADYAKYQYELYRLRE